MYHIPYISLYSCILGINSVISDVIRITLKYVRYPYQLFMINNMMKLYLKEISILFDLDLVDCS